MTHGKLGVRVDPQLCSAQVGNIKHMLDNGHISDGEYKCLGYPVDIDALTMSILVMP